MFKKLFKKKIDTPYLFSDPENTACFTCVHVLEGNSPILHVTHDEDDGGWQFLCGQESHTEEDAKIISIKEATEIDPSINGLYEMPLGVGAERETKDSEWKPYKM
jgi:hypothetical protein